VFDTAEKLTRQAVDDSKIHISPAGSILLSFKLTVGRVAITADAMATNEAIAHFETNDRALRDYTYCYLHEFKYGTLGSTSSIGTAINSDIVRRMPYIKPADEVLKNFSEGVSPIFDSILMHGNQIRTLTEARDRLLPKLMKGEIAV
jgi:type I restriction enzyme S subunit